MTPETRALIRCALDEVESELIAAMENFPPMRSAHEGVAIIDEEVLEFKEAAYWPHKQDNPDADETEVRQLAAMCVRYMIDVCYNEETPR